MDKEDSMDVDIDFDDFDDPVEPASTSKVARPPETSYLLDDSVISEREFRRALDRYYTQTQNPNLVEAPIGERVEPTTELDTLLEEVGMQKRVDEEGKVSTYIANRIIHPVFVKNLDAYFGDEQKKKKFLDLFEAAIENDDEAMIYLSPSVSERGQIDTLFRALLLAKNTQTAVFELIMKKTEYFAKDAEGDKASNDRLALACVAQVRYMDVVYDPKPLFNSIFDRALEDWRCTARDTFIQAIPEVLPCISAQQDAADNLRQMFMKNVTDNSFAYRISILRALTVLRTDADMSDKIRGELIRSVMSVEPGVLPELLNYCTSTIENEDKSSFKNVLYGLRANLKIERLKMPRGDTSKKTVGGIVMEIFEAISKRARYGGPKFWKQASVVLRVEGQMGRELSADAESMDDILPRDVKEFDLFDVLLCFALMDVDECDRIMHSVFKQQILSCANRMTEFNEIISTAITINQFSSRFIKGMLEFTDMLMWSPEEVLVECGAFILHKLFIIVPDQQQIVLDIMLKHLSDVEIEATAVLTVLQNLARDQAQLLIPFMPRLYMTFDTMGMLSTENVRSLFQALVTLQMAINNGQDELKLRMDRMLFSPRSQENAWGVLGLLMRLQAYIRLSGYGEEELEEMISHSISALDSSTRSRSNVRAVFYSNLARLLDDNPKMRRSNAMLEWSEHLLEEFREVFFAQRGNELPSNRLEDDRYTRVECKEWLRLGDLMNEVIPEDSIARGSKVAELLSHFELLRAFARQKRRWVGDDTQQAYFNHWSRFLFAFEANISMKGVNVEACENEQRALNCDIFCYAIQWIRLMLNTFADCEMETPAENELVGELMRKKYAMMIECQKCLIYTIKKVGEYTLPHMESSGRKEVKVQGEGGQILKKSSSNSSSKSKKSTQTTEGTEESEHMDLSDEDGLATAIQTSQEEDKENRDANMDEGEEEGVPKPKKRKSDHKRKLVDVTRVLSYFSAFRLVTVIKLIKLLPSKRKQTTFLLEHLQTILGVVLPVKDVKEKGIASWMANGEIPLGEMPMDHGDAKSVMKLIVGVMPVMLSILEGTVQFLRSYADTSIVDDKTKREYFNQMGALLLATLSVFRDVFKCKELSKPQSLRDEEKESERSKRARFEKRKAIMEQIERAMIDAHVIEETRGEQDAEVSVLGYLIDIASLTPSLNCAVTLLDTYYSIEMIPDDKRLQIAHIALSFLRREWSDNDGNELKGADLSKPVASILHLYLNLRHETKRLLAIQWLIANKVSELVPDDERRRSRISSMEDCIDSDLTQEDERGHFSCFTKGTFAAIYKVLFHGLNETIRSLAMNGVTKSKLKLDECFIQWKQAVSCFCLLTLMMRVKDLRNASVLLCAAREGRVFLHNFSVKGSFLHLLGAEQRFAKYGTGANGVLKTVQIGNRSLQNVSVYAKTSKCGALLKLLPELRATSEKFIRAVHSVMIGVECDDAFQIGLLKSRDLDGEEVKCPEESVDEDDESTPSDVGDTNDEDDGTMPGDGSLPASDDGTVPASDDGTVPASDDPDQSKGESEHDSDENPE